MTRYLVLAAVGVAALGAVRARRGAPAGGCGRGSASLREAMRDRQYRRLYLATALMGVPLFVPFVYLPPTRRTAASTRCSRPG